MKVKTLAFALTVACTPAFAAPLQLDVYNPQENGLFPVSSTLVSGQTEAILFDAQFSVKDGEKLVKMIKASGKRLKQIVITSSDPDFYFGLEPLVAAFPDVSVVATRKVVDHIRATKKAKLTFWAPQMKEEAPKTLIVPQTLRHMRFTLDGETLELRHPESYAAFVWFPANKAILGGTGISSGIHVWTADTQTQRSRTEWRQVLSDMEQLKPEQVIPGHYLGKRPAGDDAVRFTLRYLKDFDNALATQPDAAGVINVMEAA